jgi:hypothetical protein
MSTNRALLILSSGSVSRNLVGELGPIATSNIPLPGGLFLDFFIQNAKNYYKNVYCTLDQSKSELGRVLEGKFEHFSVHYGNSKLSIAETIHSFLQTRNEHFPMLDIVYGDTYSTSLFKEDSEENFIMVANSDGSDEWDHVKRTETGELIFPNKGLQYQDFSMTGSFRFINTKALEKSLFESMRIKRETSEISRNSREFHDALRIYESKQKETFNLKLDPLWKDLGHRRTYFKQRKGHISKGTRVFNSLEFDLKAGWVTKSGVSEKMNAELNWFNSIPNDLKHYVPSVKKHEDLNKYEIQYIPSIPLNEHWISENPNKDFWNDLFLSLDIMLKDFGSHTTDTTLKDLIELKESVYIHKVEERFDLFKILLKKKGYEENSGLNIVDLEALTSTVLQDVLNAGKEASKLNGWGVIHGDLCFSNIIYDQINETPKLIDPKGSFGITGIYGDPIYELLKLSQCILGDYDYFAANLFTLKKSNNELILDYPKPVDHEWIKSTFKDFLNEKLIAIGMDYKTFRTLEAGLFLSAAPLHSESDRWLALAIQANAIIKELQ